MFLILDALIPLHRRRVDFTIIVEKHPLRSLKV